jgi:hypothetical protein
MRKALAYLAPQLLSADGTAVPAPPERERPLYLALLIEGNKHDTRILAAFPPAMRSI